MAACPVLEIELSARWPAEWDGLEWHGRGRCKVCGGTGRVAYRRRKWRPCECVARRAFSQVWGKYVEMQRSGPALQVSMDRPWWYGRKREEFMADVERVAGVALAEDEGHRRIWSMHFVGGAGWRECCARMGLEREAFFREVDRTKRELGRAWTEVRPYALFPVTGYLGRQGFGA